MKKTLPQYVYKYTSINKYLFESLIRGQLWFSAPFDFNDPFDSYLPVNISLETYKRMEGWETNPNLIEEQQTRIAMPHIFNNNVEKLRKQFGVSCFSTVHDNLIMWSHYADNHKGLLLKFDLNELQKVFSNIKPVIYTDKVKQIDFESSPEKLIAKLLTKKSSHWKSEKEIRIIVKKYGYYNFPKTALKEIKFGLRCDDKQLRDIIDLIQKFEYKNTSFSQVRAESYNYKLSSSFITMSKEYGFKLMGDQEFNIPGIPKL